MGIPKTDLASPKAMHAEVEREDFSFIEGATSSSDRGWRFWAIFPGLGLAAALTALDTTVLSTTLPTIVESLDSNALFIWLLNAYTLSWTVVQPFYGQAANIFGRKVVIVAAIVIFMLGSGICAGANSTVMMIAGRVIQGIGAGCISVLPSLIVCDLVPQRERQKFIGLLYAAFAIGTDLGPIIGGTLVDEIGWRWVFWINIPIAGFALVLLVIFLRVEHNRSPDIMHQVLQLDFAGNLILIASVSSMLIALSSAGNQYDWNSWHTVIPLLLGFLGLILFIAYENSRWCKSPTMPLRLFSNQTSFIGYLLTFLHGILLYWIVFFLPVYFQAVLEVSPRQSGIDILPTMVPLVPFGILGGLIISRNGHYKLNQIVGFTFMLTAICCFTTLDETTSQAKSVGFQLVYSIGTGLLMTAALPAIQAPLDESDVASATATWGFVQSLGYVLGSSIPASIFSTKFDQLLPRINDMSVQEQLSHGGAYEHAAKNFTSSLTGMVKEQVITIYVLSLKLVWQVCIAFALVSLLAALCLKEVKLRETLETKFGYNNERSNSGVVEMGGLKPSQESNDD